MPQAQEQVAHLASHCALIEVGVAPETNTEFVLWHDGDCLQLLAPNDGQMVAKAKSKRRAKLKHEATSQLGVSISRDQRRLAARCAAVELEEIQRRGQGDSLLLRACGQVSGKRVLDCMAGWGVDGLLLSMRGARVTHIERSPLLWPLLIDLQQRCAAAKLVSVALTPALYADAWAVLDARARAQGPLADSQFDVVYLDPMFEQRRKGALPNKRLQWLAQLPQQTPTNLPAWVAAARALARDRVVLKRRLKDPTVAQPSWSLRGRSARFDVYAC